MTGDDRETAELLGQLKVRPSNEARERAFAHLQKDFAAAAPPARRVSWRYGVAAGFMVFAVAMGWLFMSRPVMVARVEGVQGAVELRGRLPGMEYARAGVELRAGAGVATTGGGLLVRYSPDLTVRLAAGSLAKLTSSDELELTAGRAYIDATPGANVPLRVVTPHGVVMHLGTQYLVEADAGRVQVSVREGRAQVATGSQTSVAEAGHWVMHRDGASPSAGDLPANDTRFDWIGALPTGFHLEGATLAEFLTWFHRETGLTPVYNAGVDAEDLAHVRLKGSIEHLAPLEALSYVLATADLSWHREGKQVFIERRVAGA